MHDERSEFQQIQIFDTVDFGRCRSSSLWSPVFLMVILLRMLVLDDQANLAESDLIYTETLMNQEDFKDKQVSQGKGR